MSEIPGPPSVVARISYLGRQRQLNLGDSLSFGRGSDCQVVLPNDSHISRLAGRVTVMDDCLLIRNCSSTKPFVLRPPAGEDLVVEPGAASTTLPHRHLQIVLAGQTGPIQLDVDIQTAEPLPSMLPGADHRPPRGASTVTVTAPFPLTGAQQRVLQALCTPLLEGRGPAAAPATYGQIGDALGLSSQYVRNVVQSVRETLTGHGVPDLVSDDPTRPGGDFRWSLARYAIRNRWVTTVPADPDRPGPSGRPGQPGSR